MTEEEFYVYIKVHKVGSNVVVAVCDEELLGKTIKGEKLTIKVKEEFYGGTKMKASDALRLIKDATSVNLVGNRIVERVVKMGMIHRDGVIKIGGVAHAIWVLAT